MTDVFFNGWSELARVLIVGGFSYAILLIFLRTAGKRALTKLSAYDLIVTVALGSSLATAALSSGMSVAKAALAFALLLALQRLVARASIASPALKRALNNEPTLLVYRGRILSEAMTSHSLSKDDLEAVVRSKGAATIPQVGAVVLETDGIFSVIRDLAGAEAAAPGNPSMFRGGPDDPGRGL